MKQKRFSDEQIIGILKEADAGAVALDLCCKHGMSSATFYTWKSKYGGLEEKNAKLKRLLAEAMLDNPGLKDLLGKKWCLLRCLSTDCVGGTLGNFARSQARCSRASPGQPWGERAAGVQHHRCGPDEHAVSVAARRRHRVALAAARTCPTASAHWLSSAAYPAVARRRDDQPQEGAPDLKSNLLSVL